MYRFVSLVSEKAKEQRTDSHLRALVGNKWNLVAKEECLTEFKIWARNHDYIVEKICISACNNGYLNDYPRTIEMTEKGDALIEGYGIGLIREFLTREWKFVLLVLPLATFLLGLAGNFIKRYIIHLIS